MIPIAAPGELPVVYKLIEAGKTLQRALQGRSQGPGMEQSSLYPLVFTSVNPDNPT